MRPQRTNAIDHYNRGDPKYENFSDIAIHFPLPPAGARRRRWCACPQCWFAAWFRQH